MRSADVVALMNQVERELAVDEWRLGDLRVWPLVRANLNWFDNDDYKTAGTASQAKAGRLSALAGVARGTLDAVRADRRDRAGKADTGAPAELVFLGDGVSHALVDGRWYDRLCEPLMEAAERAGMRALLLQQGYHYERVPRNRPQGWVQPAIDRVRLASALTRPSGVALEGHERALAILRDAGAGAAAIDPALLGRQAAQVTRLARHWEKLLRRTRARAAFMVGYYGTVGFALALAARRVGIPSVEIQHGSQGRLHWAYSAWLRVPAEGYEVLPDFFWAWNAADAAEIERWAGRGPHRAVAAGNPWFAKSLELAGDGAAAPAQPAVLVTLQTGLAGEGELAPILDAAANAPENWTWIARLHPTMLEPEVAAVREVIARRAPRIAVHPAESESIFAALARSSAHVTRSSSSVLEAAAMGVRSVLLDRDAEGWYPDVVARGLCTSASGPGELRAAIAAAHAARERPEAVAPLEEGLATVLAWRP